MENNIIKVPALILNKPTSNGRIYTTELMEKVIESVQPQIREQRLFVSTVPEGDERASLKDVVGLVHELTIENENLMVEFDILNTSKSTLLFSKNETEDISIRISPYGVGTVKDDVVQNDWLLLGFHIGVEKNEPTI